MANPVLGSEPAELTEQGMAGDVSQMTAEPERSYHPTRWPLANRALDLVDSMFPGKAGFVQRLVSYLSIGGCAAVVNLIVLKLMLNLLEPWKASEHWHFILASAVAYELSIFANFVPNDYFTFRHLAGHDRIWIARCARFHLTSVGGIIVTFVISATIHYGFKLDAFTSQVIALWLAVVFNFTFHHIFTYRRIGHAA